MEGIKEGFLVKVANELYLLYENELAMHLRKRV